MRLEGTRTRRGPRSPRRAAAALGALVLVASCDRAPETSTAAPPEPAAVSEPADPEPQAADADPDPGTAEPTEPETPKPPALPDPRTLGPEASTSVGSASEGHLDSSVALPRTGAGYRINPKKDPGRAHGTVELTRAVVRAAAAAHEKHPGGELTVGDLSMASGGDIGGHASHRSGRDVDVMFYLTGQDGQPFDAKPIPIEPDGTGVDYKDLTTADDDVHVKIDVPRTWAFVAALVHDPNDDGGHENTESTGTHVARIFVVEHVRTMLLEEGKRVGADKALLARVGDLMCQPKFPHDDHMHIRVFCSPDDIEAGCLDTGPVFPWHKRHLKAAGTKAKLARARTTPKPKLTSVEDAAKKAKAKVGTFAPEVDAFLVRRKSWAKKPRTGRKYCR